MPQDALPEFIESTAGQVAAELARRGVAPDQRVTIAIEPAEPDDWIAKARRYTRPKVLAEGWSDEDIDRIIKEERRAMHRPAPGEGSSSTRTCADDPVLHL